MKNLLLAISSAFLFIFPFASPADSFIGGTQYEVCFTPGQDCTGEVVQALALAKRSIYVQAYSFTSKPIANALVVAKKRGVDVKVILDKSQYKAEKYSASRFLDNQNVPVWIDSKPAIAHNKIMIIDENTVITGSFNFTKAAQEKNAENLLIIHNVALAKHYLENWEFRQKESFSYNYYQPRSKIF